MADAAGVSRALVYNYFGDRSGLLAAVELRSLERLDQPLQAALDPTLSPSEQLRPLARAYRDLARTDGSTWRVLATFGGDRHPSVRAARRSRIENLAACWGGDDAARVAARTVTAMLEAAPVTTRSTPTSAIDPGPGDRARVPHPRRRPRSAPASGAVPSRDERQIAKSGAVEPAGPPRRSPRDARPRRAALRPWR